MSAAVDTRKKASIGFSEFVSTVFWALVLALFVQSFLLQSFYIPSGSMEHTLEVGDHLFVDKLAYGYNRYSFSYKIFGLDNGIIPFEGRFFSANPKRGDIAVFRAPHEAGVDYIKRVVGLPGDKIQMKAGVLFVNGDAVQRNFDKTLDEVDGDGQHLVRKQYTETLSNHVSYHVLKLTDDGPANNTPVYEVPAGHFFMMGDNRDDSQDSRFLAEVGYVPAENLIGRARIIYFSHAGDSPIWQVWDWATTVRVDRLFKLL